MRGIGKCELPSVGAGRLSSVQAHDLAVDTSLNYQTCWQEGAISDNNLQVCRVILIVFDQSTYIMSPCLSFHVHLGSLGYCCSSL